MGDEAGVPCDFYMSIYWFCHCFALLFGLVLSTDSLYLWHIRSLTSGWVSGMQGLYWSLMFPTSMISVSLKLITVRANKLFAVYFFFSFLFPRNVAHYYSAPISQPDNRLTDGQARCCQAEYSYKFNEHPDSREFVSLLTLRTLADLVRQTSRAGARTTVWSELWKKLQFEQEFLK